MMNFLNFSSWLLAECVHGIDDDRPRPRGLACDSSFYRGIYDRNEEAGDLPDPVPVATSVNGLNLGPNVSLVFG